MKRLAIYSAILILVAGAGSCKKILDKVDFNGVPDATVWANESTATLYLNNLYNLVMPVWPTNYSSATLPTALHNISDDANGGSNTAVIYGTLTTEIVTDFFTSGTNTAYGYIRKINILLTSIDGGGLPQATRDKIKAQAYFLRAWAYFELVKLYGGVPYITTPQDWITDNLNVPRNKTSECVDSMLADLSHCSVLPTTWVSPDIGRITRDAALALKGKILLYWASPQFNPGNDATRWENAYQANEAAYDSLTNHGYALYPKFGSIFLDAASTANHEVILFRSFNGTTTTGQYEGNDAVTRPNSQSAGSGGKTNNPTWNLVRSFPMLDGRTPGDPTSLYTYDSVYYWKNRDPRFAATIAYNGCYWGLSSISGRRQWTYTGITEDKSNPSTTGFYCRKNIDSTVLAANTTNGKTWWVEMRLAEVMLNVAECANMTNRQPEAYTMIENIRKRAGINATGNPTYGLAVAMTQAQMQTAILLERRVEFAFEGKRYDDLRRTRTFDQLNGNVRMQLAIAPKSPATVASLEAKDANGVLFRDKLDVNGTDYTTYFTATVKPITSELVINYLTSYYAYALPSTNIAKDPALLQTINWGSGTFDPTQ
ncbi:MAG TPA: RagB/SusD family nutrient uptake outer membrane protein [Chitinophagaceae bacterium]